jgi:hypothetical protein
MTRPEYILFDYHTLTTSGQRRWKKPTDVGRLYSGLHTERLPFSANDDLKEAARAWIDKLCVKNGTYPPDSYPNPGHSSFLGRFDRF